MLDFLRSYARWRLRRPQIGSPTWHRDMLRWKTKQPRYRRSRPVRFPTAYDWGYANHQDRMRQRGSSS